jgi:hypothetical protein
MRTIKRWEYISNISGKNRNGGGERVGIRIEEEFQIHSIPAIISKFSGSLGLGMLGSNT